MTWVNWFAYAEYKLRHILDIFDFVELFNRKRALKIALRVRKALNELGKALGQFDRWG